MVHFDNKYYIYRCLKLNSSWLPSSSSSKNTHSNWENWTWATTRYLSLDSVPVEQWIALGRYHRPQYKNRQKGNPFPTQKHQIEQENKDKQIIHQKLVKAEKMKESLEIKHSQIRSRGKGSRKRWSSRRDRESNRRKLNNRKGWKRQRRRWNN